VCVQCLRAADCMAPGPLQLEVYTVSWNHGQQHAMAPREVAANRTSPAAQLPGLPAAQFTAQLHFNFQ
jgi:hypothetical protein